jgi:hypothetical protein
MPPVLARLLLPRLLDSPAGDRIMIVPTRRRLEIRSRMNLVGATFTSDISLRITLRQPDPGRSSAGFKSLGFLGMLSEAQEPLQRGTATILIKL